MFILSKKTTINLPVSHERDTLSTRVIIAWLVEWNLFNPNCLSYKILLLPIKIHNYFLKWFQEK